MSDQLPGTSSWPSHVATYALADAGELGREDTESRFVLDGSVAARYMLPTQLVDVAVTPAVRLLSAGPAPAPGSVAWVFSASLASDFQAVGLRSVGDYARVFWSPDLRAWQLVDSGGPTVLVASQGQSSPIGG